MLLLLLFFWEREKRKTGVSGEKPHGARREISHVQPAAYFLPDFSCGRGWAVLRPGKNRQQTQPKYDAGFGNRTWGTLVSPPQLLVNVEIVWAHIEGVWVQSFRGNLLPVTYRTSSFGVWDPIPSCLGIVDVHTSAPFGSQAAAGL